MGSFVGDIADGVLGTALTVGLVTGISNGSSISLRALGVDGATVESDLASLAFNIPCSMELGAEASLG